MTTAQEAGFGRLVQFDERSRAFPIRSLIRAIEPRSYTWDCPLWLDQGSEGACVGFAWGHELAAKPVKVAGLTNQFARNIYREAQKVDEWDGEAYEGTSVLAGAKTVSTQGYLDEYRWAFGLDDLIMAVGYKGPAVLGINWYEGMMDPDSAGYLTPSGSVVGGHAILCYGVSVTKHMFKLHNSWGPGWGNNGRALISFSAMGFLLEQQGEACIPVRRSQA